MVQSRVKTISLLAKKIKKVMSMKSVLTLFAVCLLGSTAYADLDMAALERAMANPDRPAADKERDASRRRQQFSIFWVSKQA